MSPPPPDPVDTAVAALDAAERGFVLGLLASRCVAPEDVSAALAEPAATRCVQAVRALTALDRADRVRFLGRVTHEVRRPVPAGIDDVPPDVLRSVLEAESDQTIALLIDEGPPSVRAAAAAMLISRGATASPRTAMPPRLVGELQLAVWAAIGAATERR